MNRDDCKGPHKERADYLVSSLEGTAQNLGFNIVNSPPFKEWSCAVVGKYGVDKARDCGTELIHVLKEIKDIKEGVDGKNVFSLYEEIRGWDKKNFKKARKKLDEAAQLMGLPEGYFYKKVSKELEPPKELKDEFWKKNRRLMVNCKEEGVPKFIGESPQFYQRRLPLEDRLYTATEKYVLDFYDYYAKRGGRGDSGGNIAILEDNLFNAAAAKRVADYVPTDIEYVPGDKHSWKKILVGLLKLCGIKKNHDDIKSNIKSKTEFARNKYRFDMTPCFERPGEENQHE